MTVPPADTQEALDEKGLYRAKVAYKEFSDQNGSRSGLRAAIHAYLATTRAPGEGEPVVPKHSLSQQWKEAFAAFVGAFDTPLARRQQNDEFASDARKRLRNFDDVFSAIAALSWVRYSDYIAALSTLREKLAAVEGERDFEAKVAKMLLSWAASHGEEPDLLLAEWIHEQHEREAAEARATAAEGRAEKLETALEPFAQEWKPGMRRVSAHHFAFARSTLYGDL